MKTYTSVLFTPVFFLLCPILLHAQNVGIGELNPDYKLHITNTNSSLLKLDNSTALANFVSSDLYFKTGIYYTGSIKTLGTGTNVARLGFFTFASSLSSNLLERLSITDAGLVGIGNNNPLDAGLVVDKKIGAVNAMFGRNTTGVAIESNYPGIGLNSYYNAGRKTIATGYTGLISFDPVVGNLVLYNSNASSATDAVATLSSRLFIDKDGDIGIEGNTAPHAPLSLANIVGSKISLYGSVEASNYGFGVQSNLMQIYSASSSADIAFGYGGSTAFTERMRIKGDGNVGIGTTTPSTKLQIVGGADAGFASNGYLQLGPTNSNNLVIDNNEILARNNGLQSDMWIQQDDGNLMLCGLGLGSVGIGVATPTDFGTGYILSVKGKVIAEEVRVQLFASWPDYVFHPDYALMPLDHLEKYIGENHHLPGFDVAAKMEAEGADVGETQRRLLEKVEELTLYVIELKKEIDQLKNK